MRGDWYLCGISLDSFDWCQCHALVDKTWWFLNYLIFADEVLDVTKKNAVKKYGGG